jgi:hypothetical protein
MHKDEKNCADAAKIDRVARSREQLTNVVAANGIQMLRLNETSR